MQESQLITNEKYKRIHRIYLTLDKPFNSCIIDYKWSSVEPEWVFDKMVWNTLNKTYIENNLRDGKYTLSII